MRRLRTHRRRSTPTLERRENSRMVRRALAGNFRRTSQHINRWSDTYDEIVRRNA